MAGKKKKTEAQKNAQRVRTANNKIRKQKRIERRLKLAAARRAKKLAEKGM